MVVVAVIAVVVVVVVVVHARTANLMTTFLAFVFVYFEGRADQHSARESG
jgi:hypothetical protein